MRVKKALSELVFADLMFIFLLALSSLFSGPLFSVFYGAAFVLPTLAIMLLWQRRDGEQRLMPVSFSLNRRGIGYFLLFCAPLVLTVILFSYLTSLLLGLIGAGSSVTDVGDNLFFAVMMYAVAPAIFEEMLFRYIPIRALGEYSPRLAVIYSAVLFSLAHCNLFQIPYALLAGVIFAALDLCAKSILPSLLLHLFNNLLSVAVSFSSSGTFYIIFFSLLGLASLISVVYIVINRKNFFEPFKEIFADKSKLIFTKSFCAYILVSVLIAALLIF